jgi:hypothetical protein
MARLLKIGFDFGNLACGLEIINPVPEKITYDYELTALKRSYGDDLETPEVAGGASVLASRSASEGNPPSVPAGDAGGPSQGVRCDAWSRWARTMRRLRS